MRQHNLCQTLGDVSAIGLGTWQLGADWGTVDEADAMAILKTSFDAGVTFFDTADVYGDGRSEQLVGRFRSELTDPSSIVVATKMGRRGPQDPAEFNVDNFRQWNDRSRQNLGVESIDLVQLHCPPTPVFEMDSVFDELDRFVEEGRIRAYGVSVETCDEALRALDRPNLCSIQIILNVFRRKPLDEVLPRAAAKGVGIIARVPLASGLLSGKFSSASEFDADDHRSYNRQGEAFDVGETFSGVDYQTGLRATTELASVNPEMTPAQIALKWVLQQPGVTTVIPGASLVEQAEANARVAELDDLTPAQLGQIEQIYDEHFRQAIHPRW